MKIHRVFENNWLSFQALKVHRVFLETLHRYIEKEVWYLSWYWQDILHISKTALEIGTLLKQDDRGVKVVFDTSGIFFSSQKSQLWNVIRRCKGTWEEFLFSSMESDQGNCPIVYLLTGLFLLQMPWKTKISPSEVKICFMKNTPHDFIVVNYWEILINSIHSGWDIPIFP